MVIGGIGVIHRFQERPGIFMGFQGLKHWKGEIKSDQTLQQTVTQIGTSINADWNKTDSVNLPLYRAV